jgi:hypothetical protein
MIPDALRLFLVGVAVIGVIWNAACVIEFWRYTRDRAHRPDRPRLILRFRRGLR